MSVEITRYGDEVQAALGTTFPFSELATEARLQLDRTAQVFRGSAGDDDILDDADSSQSLLVTEGTFREYVLVDDVRLGFAYRGPRSVVGPLWSLTGVARPVRLQALEPFRLVGIPSHALRALPPGQHLILLQGFLRLAALDLTEQAFARSWATHERPLVRVAGALLHACAASVPLKRDDIEFGSRLARAPARITLRGFTNTTLATLIGYGRRRTADFLKPLYPHVERAPGAGGHIDIVDTAGLLSFFLRMRDHQSRDERTTCVDHTQNPELMAGDHE